MRRRAKARKPSAWVACADKVPEHARPVIAWIVGPALVVAGEPFADVCVFNEYGKGKWWCAAYGTKRDVEVQVSHWLPLPEAPV